MKPKYILSKAADIRWLGLVAFTALIFAFSAAAQPQIIYRETFGRPLDSTGNINPTNFNWIHYTAAGTAHMTGHGISADGTGKPTNATNVNAGPNLDGTFDAYEDGWAYVDGTERLHFTPEYQFDLAGYLPGSIVFSWYQGIANITTGFHVMLRIDGIWYVTVQGFTNTTAVSSGASFGNDGPGGAELMSWTFDPSADQWRTLTFDGDYNHIDQTHTDSTLGEPLMGGVPSTDLSGTVTAFGLIRFNDNAGGLGNSRFDTFTIEAEEDTDAPRITNIVPANHTTYYTAANGMSFNVESTAPGGIPDGAISLVLNGQEVNSSASFQVTGTAASRSVSYGGLVQNKVYKAVINATNALGDSRTVSISFDTIDLTTGTTLEAENFNFDGGQYINDPWISYTFPPTTNYYGQGYENGIEDVDFHELDPLTRPESGNEWRWFGLAGLSQTEVNTDLQRQEYADAFVPEYDLVNVEAGEWWNYTRDFNGENYEVYLRVRSSVNQRLQLDRVTNDRTQPNQSTLLLGSFDVSSGGYGYAPLLGPNGDQMVLNLNGTETLRLTALDANNDISLNYILLLPTTNAATVLGPYVENIFPEPDATSGSRELITATISNRETALANSTVELLVDGTMVSGVDVTPTATGADISYQVTPPFSTSTKHTNELRYQDTMANQYSVTWSYTTSADTDGPLLVYTGGNIVGGALTLRVFFDEPVESATATTLTNYQSSGGVTFSAATLINPQVVELSGMGGAEGQRYQLTVNNVQDAVGNPILADSMISYNVSPFEQGSDGLVVVEAEGYHSSTNGAAGTEWESQTWEFSTEEPGFSGGGAMHNPDAGATTALAAQGARLAYRVHFNQAGTYKFWLHGLEAGGSDSIFFGDNEFFAVSSVTGIDPPNYDWADNVQTPDTEANILNVFSPGETTIYVWVREDGIYFDKFVLAPTDVGFDPAQFNGGFGPDESPRTGDLFAPGVVIDSPASGPIKAGSDVTINATVTDLDDIGGPHTVEFFVDGTKVGEDTTAPYSFTLPNPASGTYALSAKVTDDDNLTGTTLSDVVITIDGEAPAPIFTAASSGSLLVRVYFSEPVDSATATNVNNYTSSGGVTFNSVTLIGDSAVELSSTDTVADGTVNTLTVNNVEDLVGNVVVNTTLDYNPSAFEQAPDGLLVIEAESYHNKVPGTPGGSWDFSFEPQFQAGYSGGGGMGTPSVGAPNSNPEDLADVPRMDYRVNFTQTGTYEIWIRGMIFDGGDSFHIGTNSVQIGGITGINEGDGVWSWDNDVQGGTGQDTFTVDTPGEYTINVWAREDGARLDKFALILQPATSADYGFNDAALSGAIGPDQSRRTGDPVPIGNPEIGNITIDGTEITIAGTGGAEGGTYRVLSSEDVTLPVTQWTPVATNTFVTGGDFSTTLTITNDPMRFYQIAIP